MSKGVGSKVKPKEYQGLKIASSLSVILSLAVYLAIEWVNHDFYTPDFRVLYTYIILGGALISLISFAICVIAVIKIKKQRHLYVIFPAITFTLMCLELASAALFNFFD